MIAKSTVFDIKFIISFGVFLLIARIVLLPILDLALFYDEAYYHLWSTVPAWGYYSKPPMVAWLIMLTTSIFGHAHEWSVRISSPLLYTATAYVIYLIGKRLYSRQVGAVSALIFISAPIVTFNSLFITTDAPLLFFWSLTAWLFLRALDSDRLVWWASCGVAAGLGLLSKYTMGLLAVGIFIYLVFYERRRLMSYGPWLTAIIAFLVFLPNLVWNWQHDFISFQHTGEISKLSEKLLHPIKFLEFFVGQFFIIGPVGMWLFLRFFFKREKNQSSIFLLSISLPILLIILLQSLLARAHVNWAAPAYIGASLIAGYSLLQADSRKLATWLLSINMFLALAFYAYSPIQSVLGVEPTRRNTPFYRVTGWRELIDTAKMEYPKVEHMIWLSDSRKLLSYAHYYLSDWQIGQVLSVAGFNVDGHVSHHFDLLYDVNSIDSEIYLFVSEVPRSFTGCFQEVDALGHVIEPGYPLLNRELYLYIVRGFNGYQDCNVVRI